MKRVVDSSEFGEKLSTALDSQDRKTLEKRLQVRRNRTGYEAVISARFTVFRACNWEQMFEVEDRLTAELVGALEVKLQAPTKRPVVSQESRDLEAFEQYAEGRKKLRELGKSALEAARLHFECALSLHPQYAMAHSGLGATYAMRFIHRADPTI